MSDNNPFGNPRPGNRTPGKRAGRPRVENPRTTVLSFAVSKAEKEALAKEADCFTTISPVSGKTQHTTPMSTIDNAMAGYKRKKATYARPLMGAHHKVGFLAPLEIYDRLKAYEKTNGCSTSDAIRAALDKFLPPTP